MQQAKLLVIDEVTMEHRYLYECQDHSLQDVRGNNIPFGGLTILFSGDWKQILPVVKRGSWAQVIDATLKKITPMGEHTTIGIAFQSPFTIIAEHTKFKLC